MLFLIQMWLHVKYFILHVTTVFSENLLDSETSDIADELLQISTFLTGLIQLCHYNTQLAHDVWLTLFPRCWKVLSERMQAVSL